MIATEVQPSSGIGGSLNVGVDDLRFAGAGRPRILCVDDEPEVLEGLSLHLERPYRFYRATSGAEALALLKSEGPFAIVISDMRMPRMDGGAFLKKVREQSPEAIRILLTGHADLDAAIAAVNEGQVFRFLTKPCPPRQLLSVLQAAMDQYRLILSERVLLEMTLTESVKALTEVLALADPLAFGRAQQITKYASGLVADLGIKNKWPIEIAAMVSQIGCLGLPKEILGKLHCGGALSPAEAEKIDKLPLAAEKLIGHIPRLEDVRAILVQSAKSTADTSTPIDPQAKPVGIGGEILRIASDFYFLECSGFESTEATNILRSRKGRYHPELLAAFTAIYAGGVGKREITEVSMDALQAGMILAEDIRLKNGVILAGRGYEVTSYFIEHAQNWRASITSRVVRIVARRV